MKLPIQKTFIVRGAISMAFILLATLPFLVSLTTMSAVLAINNLHSQEDWTLFLMGLFHITAWVTFLAMTVAWVMNKKLSKPVVWVGCLSALVAVTPWIGGIIFTLPAVGFAIYLMYFHLS